MFDACWEVSTKNNQNTALEESPENTETVGTRVHKKRVKMKGPRL